MTLRKPHWTSGSGCVPPTEFVGVPWLGGQGVCCSAFGTPSFPGGFPSVRTQALPGSRLSAFLLLPSLWDFLHDLSRQPPVLPTPPPSGIFICKMDLGTVALHKMNRQHLCKSST